MIKLKDKHKNKIISLKIKGRFITLDTSKVLSRTEMEFYQDIGFDIFETEEKPKKVKKYKGIEESETVTKIDEKKIED